MKKGALIIVLWAIVGAPFSFCIPATDETLTLVHDDLLRIESKLEGQGGDNDLTMTNNLLRMENYLLLFGIGIMLFIVYRAR